MTDFTAKMHQIRVRLTALTRTLAEFKARGQGRTYGEGGDWEREDNGEGRSPGREGSGERVESGKGKWKDKGEGMEGGGQRGWAGLGKGGDGEAKYD